VARKRRGDRVLGPYRNIGTGGRPDRWRAIIVGEDGSKRHRDFSTEAQAREYIAAARAELQATAGITFGQALQEYEQHLVAKGNKPRSIATTMLVLGRMFRPEDGSLSALRTEADGQRLYDELRNRKDEKTGDLLYAVDSHRNTLAESKTFLRWCLVKKYIKTNVLETVQGMGRRKKGADASQLRIDEARRWTSAAIRSAQEKRDEGAIAALVALLMGLRASEIVNRTVRDVDNRGTLLWIPDSKTPAGKRTIEIPDPLRPFLRRQAAGKPAEHLLFGKGLKPRDRNWVRKSVKRICRLAGIPEQTAHALRRSHSTLAVEAGATSHAVTRALGHEAFSTTTDSYVRRGTVDRVKARQVVDLLDIDPRRGPRKASRAQDDVLPGATLSPKNRS
jgi:integrase